MSESILSALPRALGGPFGTATFKAAPEDFVVDEQLDVPEHPTGAHWWLRLAKRDMNTKDVARVLADLGGVRIREVGFAGMKDRQAVATQWLRSKIELDEEVTHEEMLDYYNGHLSDYEFPTQARWEELMIQKNQQMLSSKPTAWTLIPLVSMTESAR